MTIEEALSEIEKLKDGNKSLADKNAEILNEMKQERKKNRDSDESSQKFYELQDKYDDLKELNTKLERDFAKSTKDIEKLTQTNEGLNGLNTKLIIDDGISKELHGLERFKVREGGIDVTVEALKKLNPTIVDGVANFDGKTAKEFISEWANSDNSKFYLQSKESSGGGAGGGGSGGNPKGNLDGSKSEQEAYIKEKFNIA